MTGRMKTTQKLESGSEGAYNPSMEGEKSNPDKAMAHDIDFRTLLSLY
jgi:hypothetical protein